MIRSRPQPGWIDDRLDDLAAALTAAHIDIENLSKSIDQLDPTETAAQLKQELRAAEHRLPTAHDADGNRRIESLRRRYDTVHDMMNQRLEIAQRVADSIADLELLAVESMRTDGAISTERYGLDDHLERLEIDLAALRSAREDVDSW